MSDAKIHLCVPHLGGNEGAYLQECVETNFVSSVGPFVDRVRARVRRVGGLAPRGRVLDRDGRHPRRVCASRASLPATRFWSRTSRSSRPSIRSPTSVRDRCWSMPTSRPGTWTLGLVTDELERRARAGRAMPKAVLVAHVLGLPANIEPIADACERHGVTLIEDAAEALGAELLPGALRWPPGGHGRTTRVL